MKFMVRKQLGHLLVILVVLIVMLWMHRTVKEAAIQAVVKTLRNERENKEATLREKMEEEKVTAVQKATTGCPLKVPEWARDTNSDSLAKDFINGSGGLTDKSTSHRYQIMYHRYLSPIMIRFSQPKFRMLEIGLGCGPTGGMGTNTKPGGSTLAWKHIFSFSTIELDLHVLEYDAECASKWEKENPGIATKIHSGDASSTEDLERVYRDSGGLPFDMIIDDASHLNEHQIFTFLHMIQYVSKGGFYVIEDIHSSCASWLANTGSKPTGKIVQGTKGCMETATGNPTIFSKLIEWQKPLLIQKSPFPDVTSIEISLEAAVITKQY